MGQKKLDPDRLAVNSTSFVRPRKKSHQVSRQNQNHEEGTRLYNLCWKRLSTR